jgi:hypothetical protein
MKGVYGSNNLRICRAMDVFISWSGHRSKMLAEALAELLPRAIRDTKTWMSAVDIDPGNRWESELDRHLEDSDVGILCLTPENLGSRWLMFEAGALAKSGSDARVVSYCLGLAPAEVPHPLGRFQGVPADEPGTKKLVRKLNRILKQPIDPVRLERDFTRWWPKLRTRIAAIPSSDDGSLASQERDRQIAATQPLSALSLQFCFSSSDAKLRRRMNVGKDRIWENAESSQGGSPSVPFEVMDFEEALLPLLRYIAQIGPKTYDDLIEVGCENVDENSLVVLIPLDESNNAILSFAHVSSEVEWDLSPPNAQAERDPLVNLDWAQSVPRVKPMRHAKAGISTYEIHWTLDPAALRTAIQRLNPDIPSMGRLPKTLRMAIFYDIACLPFRPYDFTKSSTWGLWLDEDTTIRFGDRMADAGLTVSVNGASQPTYRYRLKAVQRKTLLTEYEDELPARCTMLVFEQV